MRPFYHIILILFAAILAILSLPSCSSDSNGMDSPEPQQGTIRVNTVAVGGSRAGDDGSSFDNTFMILLWDTSNAALLEKDTYGVPYHRSIAPQPVMFYTRSVYDTRYPYLPENREDRKPNYLYATGYAPGNVLEPMLPKDNNTHNYEILTANVPAEQIGRYDFLGCDLWKDVYKGCQDDPFSQEKNKLYFRHLAAKLTFYADRDKATMENKQFVRNVEITNLRMSIDGGKTWTEMYTPSEFKWEKLESSDFTKAYRAAIDNAKGISGVTSDPNFGYKATKATGFAGAGNSDFVLKKPTVDRVPIGGMDIDSCYVCNPIGDDGKVSIDQPIQIRMDISADMSYHPSFPKPENDHDTNDLTFTRKWENVTVTKIKAIDADGKETTESIKEFKPGHEYRIYIHFFRTGINLVAKEMPWDYGGLHYVTIPGSDPKEENPDDKKDPDPTTPDTP